MVSTQWYVFLVGAGQRFAALQKRRRSAAPPAPSGAEWRRSFCGAVRRRPAPDFTALHSAACKSVLKLCTMSTSPVRRRTAPTALQSSAHVGIGLDLFIYLYNFLLEHCFNFVGLQDILLEP